MTAMIVSVSAGFKPASGSSRSGRAGKMIISLMASPSHRMKGNAARQGEVFATKRGRTAVHEPVLKTAVV
jgi:hypothetical protein